MSSRSSAALECRPQPARHPAPARDDPGRLRLAGVLVTLSAIVFGVVAIRAADTRAQAVAEVRATELRLAQAVEISASLSDAHATTARSFLVGEPETARSRAEYKRALRQAGAGVAEPRRRARHLAAGAAGDPASRARAVGVQRADRRRARELSPGLSGRGRVPATGRRHAARRAAAVGEPAVRGPGAQPHGELSSRASTAARCCSCSSQASRCSPCWRRRRSTSRAPRAACSTCASRSRRRSCSGCWAGSWSRSAVQARALEHAQRDGSDPIELLTATRILASRAQGNESIALSARGGGEGEPSIEDIDRGFVAVTAPIEGLLGRSRPPRTRPRRSVTAIRAAYTTYLDAHDRVVTAERNGDFTRAVVARRQRSRQRRGTVVHEGGRRAGRRARARGARRAAALRRARRRRRLGGRGAPDGIPLLSALCALLALSGVRRRLDEYR